MCARVCVCTSIFLSCFFVNLKVDIADKIVTPRTRGVGDGVDTDVYHARSLLDPLALGPVREGEEEGEVGGEGWRRCGG